MRQLLTIFTFLITSQFALSQGEIDKFLTDFASENHLYNKRLQKLESIRIKDETLTIPSEEWKNAFAKWDKNDVTDSICIEHLLIEPYSRNACKDPRFPPSAHSVGYPMKYLYELVDIEVRNHKISEQNTAIAKNLILAQAMHDDLIQQDIELLEKAYSSHFMSSPITSVQCNLIVNFVSNDTSKKWVDLVERISRFDYLDFNNLKDFLIQNDISYKDVLLTLYANEMRMHPDYSFPYCKLPSLSLKENSAAGDDFNYLMGRELNLSKAKEIDFLKISPFLENETIRSVSLFKLIFDKWYEFELKDFEQSKSHKYLTRSGLMDDPWGDLIEFENEFEKTKFSNAFELTGKSTLEQLFISAYNDVYFDLRFHPDETIIAKKINLDEFELSDKQREIIEALSDTNWRTSQVGLKKSLAGISFGSLETERSFMLACYLIFDRKAYSIERDWNEPVFYTNPFGAETKNDSIQLPTIDPIRLTECKKQVIDLLEKTYYPIGTYTESMLNSQLTTASHQIYYGDRIEIGNIMHFAQRGKPAAPYMRMCVTTMKEVDRSVRMEPEIMNDNPFGNGNSARGQSFNGERVYDVPPPPILAREPQPKPIEAGVVAFPDKMATFPGGPAAQNVWIQQNLQYPEIAMELGDQGRVIVRFVVEVDGSITNVEVHNGGISSELNREAKRLVRTMPKWIPAELKGKKVRTRCELPFDFYFN